MAAEHRTVCYNVWCLQLQLNSVATEDPLFLAVSLGMKHCQQSLPYQGLSPCLLELLNREADGYTQQPTSQLEIIAGAS